MPLFRILSITVLTTVLLAGFALGLGFVLEPQSVEIPDPPVVIIHSYEIVNGCNGRYIRVIVVRSDGSHEMYSRQNPHPPEVEDLPIEKITGVVVSCPIQPLNSIEAEVPSNDVVQVAFAERIN